MRNKQTRVREITVEYNEREAPIAPLGSQLNYSQMMLTEVRSAPTNMGWKSVFVTLILALACAGATSVFYMVRVPSSDTFSAVLVRSHMQDGNTLYDAGHYDEAIVEYNKAIVGRADYDLAYYARGQAYEAKGEKAQAAADYHKVLEVSSDESMKQAVQARLQQLEATSP